MPEQDPYDRQSPPKLRLFRPEKPAASPNGDSTFARFDQGTAPSNWALSAAPKTKRNDLPPS
jgi:hypothetical protein